jgi:hypothetical protein
MKKPPTVWRAMTAVCVVYAGLFVGYAAAYLVLVEREYPRMGAFRCLFAANEPVPRYWVGGTTVYRVFAPAHSLDRRLRPDYWAASAPLQSFFAPVTRSPGHPHH